MSVLPPSRLGRLGLPLVVGAQLAGATLLGGCDQARAPTPAPPGEMGSKDKSSLYGNARLVPSREGERIRREVALAGELRSLLAPLTRTRTPPAVDVELPSPSPLEPTARIHRPRVVIVVDADWSTQQRRDVDQLVHAVVPRAELTVITSAGPAADGGPRPAQGAPWPLALALLGLGVSLGVFVERAAGRTKLSFDGLVRPRKR